MRRRLQGLVGVLVLATLSTAATGTPAPPQSFTSVEGTVLAEGPTPEAIACAWRKGGDESQGLLGWVVELQPGEGDGTHVYQLSSEGRTSALGVTFFAELPTCGTTSDHSLEVLGDRVPAGARWAVIGRWDVQMTYGGTMVHPRVAAAATFHFEVEDPFEVAGFPAFELGATISEVPVGRPALTVALSRARFGSHRAAHAVLTRMDVFADSLAGAPLAADGPMLGVWPDELPRAVAGELQRVLPEEGTVYLLGGQQAISDTVAGEVASLGFTTQRLAGATRIQTALAVADEVRRANPDLDEVGLARARGATAGDTAGWADSVAGGAWAARRGVPILITESEALHPDVSSWLARVEPSRTVLFGGEHALSAAVEAAVRDPYRVGGVDRAATAALVARELWGTSSQTTPQRFVVVHGWAELGWLWGLPAAGLAADEAAPVLLVSGNEVPGATAELVTSCARTHIVVSGASDDPAVGVTSPTVRELKRLADQRC